jgi:hypothetical protein
MTKICTRITKATLPSIQHNTTLIHTSTCLFAPVQTIFPELKISAVVRGSRILMITAAKRFGLYSALRAFNAMVFRSSLQPRLTVDTIFCNSGTIPDRSTGMAGLGTEGILNWGLC